jgi:predicted ATPase/tRNA A-37 threonylcarbamoyl transferase component Bud32
VNDLIRDRYELIAEIGRGGQGRVFQAHDRQHDRLIALKVRSVEADRQEILDEASILLGLKPHPNLPLVRDDFFVHEDHYLVMDWIDGENLQTKLDHSGRPGLPLNDVLDYLDPVASALDHLHAHVPPIYHGDVKPKNIMLTRDGTIVLVDFGIATRGSSRRSAGTSAFVAPEQVRGEMTAASDIFGLAATAFTLLVGEPPSPGIGSPWANLPEHRARAVELAFRRALSFEPSRRPTSAGEFVEALRSAPTLRTNLPAQLTSFVGRESEIDELIGLLKRARLVTLTGPGGIGKTRLALQVSSDLLDVYVDGVWLVELAALVEPSSIVQSVALALGLQDEADVDLLDAITDYVASRHLLIVFDNCEHLIGEVAIVAERLLRTSRNLCIVATSREPLKVEGEEVWAVPALPIPPDDLRSPEALLSFEAVRLFCERATRAMAAFRVTHENTPSIVAICRRLDGIPLALELAAARVKVLPTDQIAARLDRRFDLLTAGSRTALPRQQTLRAAMDWSYDLLAEPERVLLRRLSVFNGGFKFAAGAHVCANDDSSELHTLDLLSQLVDKSLVGVDYSAVEPRYFLLETVRTYASEQLHASGEAALVRSTHARYFLDLAEQAERELTGADQRTWLTLLASEHDNLREALRWSAEQSSGELVRLAGALGRFWKVRGYFSEGRDWLARAIASDSEPTDSMAKALTAAADLALLPGDYTSAQELLTRGLEIWRRLHNDAGIAECLNMLGVVADLRGDYGMAQALYEDAFTIRRALGDKWGIAASLSNLGGLAQLQGDYERARDLYRESLALRRTLNDRRGIATSLNNLGESARALGNYSEASALFEESVAVYDELQDQAGAAAARTNLGIVSQILGRIDEAKGFFSESLAICLKIGDRVDGVKCLEGLAMLACREKQWERAALVLGSADALRESLGTPIEVSERKDHEGAIAETRAALGATNFEHFWREGHSIPWSAAAELGNAVGTSSISQAGA